MLVLAVAVKNTSIVTGKFNKLENEKGNRDVG